MIIRSPASIGRWRRLPRRATRAHTPRGTVGAARADVRHGRRADALALATALNIDRLPNEAPPASAMTARRGDQVGAGMASIFTGVEPTKHRVTMNGFCRHLTGASTVFGHPSRARPPLGGCGALRPSSKSTSSRMRCAFNEGTDTEVTEAMVELAHLGREPGAFRSSRRRGSQRSRERL